MSLTELGTFVGHVFGDGACLTEDPEAFREILVEAKERGSEMRLVGHSCLSIDPGFPGRPFIFNCERCREFAATALEEVFGELPPLETSPLCGGSSGSEEIRSATRQAMTSLRAAGGRVTFYGTVAEFSRHGYIYEAKQFQCSHCLDLCRSVTEEVFGGAN